MSEADELFDELCYEKIHDNKRRIVYKDGILGRIEFDMKNRCVSFNFSVVNMQELQAINEKCKELGWLE